MADEKKKVGRPKKKEPTTTNEKKRQGGLQDGRGIKWGDYLPPHKYVKKNHLHVEQLL